MTEPDLTRQDEDVPATDYLDDLAKERQAFGNWPEVFGLVLTAVLVWLLFTLNG